MRFSTRCFSDPAQRPQPRECRIAKWVSNVAMQVTSKNNHKKFGNIWGCFCVKYRAGTHSEIPGEAARTTARCARSCRKCRAGASGPGIPAGKLSPSNAHERKSDEFHQPNDARFFADFFSLESISIRYIT
ncbi:hypothetical protein [Burkholderia ubonensis]|uniref:hypothetical protein n=1 Tax=Burkholderia ubonensis TaxID=101571 RepID=UPI000AB0CABA|nr:hypothetical protein [Burkholderia ubonensis]